MTENIVCAKIAIESRKFLDSSMVEHAAVNRRVVGSSPTRGAKNFKPLPSRGFLYSSLKGETNSDNTLYIYGKI